VYWTKRSRDDKGKNHPHKKDEPILPTNATCSVNEEF
jgi:hypothetical protein